MFLRTDWHKNQPKIKVVEPYHSSHFEVRKNILQCKDYVCFVMYLVFLFSAPLPVVEYNTYGWDIFSNAGHNFIQTHSPRPISNICNGWSIGLGNLENRNIYYHNLSYIPFFNMRYHRIIRQ